MQIFRLRRQLTSYLKPILRANFLGLMLLVFAAFLDDTYALQPGILTGWSHTQGSATLPGLNVPAGNVSYSSPAIAEIDGDLTDGREIVVATSDGHVHVFRSNGQLLWTALITPISGPCSKTSIYSSPAVGAIFGDGQPYVVVGYGGFSKKCDGGVAVLRGSDGQPAWQFSTAAFAKSQHFWAILHGVFSSPAVADVDGDGKMEIGFGSFDRYVFLLNYDGTVRWYYQAADSVWSSPAFANVDQDPDLEMIIGTDISGNKRIRPITKDGGYLYAFKTKPRARQLILFRDRTAFFWKAEFDQIIDSSPVIADLIPENAGDEVAIGSGCFFPQQKKTKRGKWLKILSLKTGAVLRTLPNTGCSPSSAAIADLNGDGQLDVVQTVSGNRSIGGDGVGRVMAWNPASGQLLWSVVPRVHGRNDSWIGHFSSPVIADLDGNGSLEVIVVNTDGASILNGSDGSEITCNNSSCDNSPLNVRGSGSFRASPAIGDINDDGVPDLVMANSRIYAWTGFSSTQFSVPGPEPTYSIPWAMFRGNSQHTGK